MQQFRGAKLSYWVSTKGRTLRWCITLYNKLFTWRSTPNFTVKKFELSSVVPPQCRLSWMQTYIIVRKMDASDAPILANQLSKDSSSSFPSVRPDSVKLKFRSISNNCLQYEKLLHLFALILCRDRPPPQSLITATSSFSVQPCPHNLTKCKFNIWLWRLSILLKLNGPHCTPPTSSRLPLYAGV